MVHVVISLGPDVRARVNDNWRERYVDYRGMIKLLKEVKKNEAVGPMTPSHPLYRDVGDSDGPDMQPTAAETSGISSSSQSVPRTFRSMLTTITHAAIGGSYLKSLPSSQSIRQRIEYMFEPPQLAKDEMSLGDLELVFDKKNSCQRLGASPSAPYSSARSSTHVSIIQAVAQGDVDPRQVGGSGRFRGSLGRGQKGRMRILIRIRLQYNSKGEYSFCFYLCAR